jgi:phosphoribosyl 1,2-cyclic phosphate phosphodiesterase
MNVKVTFLGTGTSQGVPIIGCDCAVCKSVNPKDKRLRSSVLLEVEGKTFAIDTGPDFRQQMLREKVRQMDAILFTHEHKDHTGGFDDIRGFNFIHKKAVEVYLDERVEICLKRDFGYAFAEVKYPGVPDANLHIIENKPFEVAGVTIIPILVYHYKLPVFGFRIGDFTYITDANRIDPKEREKIKGSKVMVLNALRKTEHISHFNLQQAIDFATELNIPKTYLTHFSHQMGLHDEVSKELPSHVEMGYDGLKIEV